MRYVAAASLLSACCWVESTAIAASTDIDIGLQALQRGDYAEAYCLWRPLADQGSAEAQYHLGWLYANGNGLAVDIDRAVALWMQAAGHGHADAQFAIGLAYTTGEGMRMDLDEAVDWFLMAARQGHQDARDILVRLNGDPEVALLQRHPELAGEDWFGWQARITGDRINVRGGPGTQHPVVTQLDQGTIVRVIGQRDEWYLVVLDGGTTAWIHRVLVTSTQPGNVGDAMKEGDS